MSVGGWGWDTRRWDRTCQGSAGLSQVSAVHLHAHGHVGTHLGVVRRMAAGVDHARPRPCGINTQVPGRACASVLPEGVHSYLPSAEFRYPILASTSVHILQDSAAGHGGDRGHGVLAASSSGRLSSGCSARLAGRLESMNDAVEELTALVRPGPGAREGLGL